MNQVICKKPPKVVAKGNDGVFVKGDVTYMISDDLQVSPVSTASALSLLKDLGIGLRTTFEEHNVRVSAEEVCYLLASTSAGILSGPCRPNSLSKHLLSTFCLT